LLFNSLEFILFGLIFFGLWPLLRKWKNTRWIYLTGASFVFYGWWDWRFLLLILGSGLIDYFAALAMVRWSRRRRVFLIASILGNVASLGVFKYLDFLIGNLNGLAGMFGFDVSLSPVGLILPVGISFYTFQSMSYTIDVYRKQLKPTHNIFHFFAYLSMFPQLVAGPIVRAADLLPQLETAQPTTRKQRFDGLRLTVYGFFKKVVVADTLAKFVDTAFGSETLSQSSSYWWLIMTMYAFQIYCDFSGYSDIARGLAKWMGYEFPLNFDHPYISTSIREFWSRWHISLSTWFRDYVYIPLGGSRKGELSSHINMWFTMTVSGLWHGAAWTFVVWGALHAFYLSIERVTNWPKKIRRIPAGKHIALVIVFVLVLISWVFFRAQSFAQAGAILKTMFLVDPRHPGLGSIINSIDAFAIALVLLMAARQAYLYLGLGNSSWATSRWAEAARPVLMAILIAASVFLRGPSEAFIYFQF